MEQPTKVTKFPICILFYIVMNSYTLAFPQYMKVKHFGSEGKLGEPAGNVQGSLPPDQWIVQPLDHFNPSDTRTWKQRYFVNATFHKPGGPVFLMIGGEGTASPKWMVMGQWITYAQKYNALCVQLEHRFYGKSHPTADTSVESLQFLSSEQALADLASFITYINEKMSVQNSKWISFGGSYPGALAAWVRLKYPHLIHASVSTSAPVIAKLNFPEYLGVVRDSLATTGAECNKAISDSTKTITSMLQSDSGRKQLKSLFNLCEDINIKDSNDIANLYSSLAGNFENVVQYNKDNRAFEGAIGTNITIDTLCGIMTNESLGQPSYRYAAVNNLILKTYGEKCLDFSYANMINDLKKTDWNSSASEGGRQWIYQTCTEFGYYQSSDLDNQPFGQKFPLSFLVQQCKDIYGAKFTQEFIEAGINRTNTMYGGYGLKVTRVVFLNGSIDPWHALGITKNITQDATAIFIQGTAHCANMYPDSPSDPPQLKEARQKIETLIGQWLTED